MSERHEPADGIPERSPGQSQRPGGRRPRMVPFLATGALLGSFIGLVITLLGPPSESGPAQEAIILGLTGALLGGLFGGIVYLLIERALSR